MDEYFLQYLWKHRLVEPRSLKTTDGHTIEVISTGEQNTDSGPDFINARLKIDNILWCGNVEVHFNSSDWNKHGHFKDKAYDNVILQIVVNADAKVKSTSGQEVTTAKLEPALRFYENYQSLLNSGTPESPACANQLGLVDPFTRLSWLNALLLERLERKALQIEEHLAQNKNNWEETFYHKLSRSFGSQINAAPFEMLAKSLPITVIAKHKSNLKQIEALFFGQAGLLDEEQGDEYYLALRKEYLYLQHKFALVPIEKHLWKFLRLRPCNFPTVRIAQFAKLVHQSSALFSKIIASNDIDILGMWFDTTASTYWDTHYTFGKESKTTAKQLGDQAIESILINTAIPFMFVYGKAKQNDDLVNKALEFLEKLPAENNHITEKWKIAGIDSTNSAESQALIQLDSEYCRRSRCLNCRIGSKIIRRISLE